MAQPGSIPSIPSASPPPTTSAAPASTTLAATPDATAIAGLSPAAVSTAQNYLNATLRDVDQLKAGTVGSISSLGRDGLSSLLRGRQQQDPSNQRALNAMQPHAFDNDTAAGVRQEYRDEYVSSLGDEATARRLAQKPGTTSLPDGGSSVVKTDAQGNLDVTVTDSHGDTKHYQVKADGSGSQTDVVDATGNKTTRIRDGSRITIGDGSSQTTLNADDSGNVTRVSSEGTTVANGDGSSQANGTAELARSTPRQTADSYRVVPPGRYPWELNSGNSAAAAQRKQQEEAGRQAKLQALQIKMQETEEELRQAILRDDQQKALDAQARLNNLMEQYQDLVTPQPQVAGPTQSGSAPAGGGSPGAGFRPPNIFGGPLGAPTDPSFKTPTTSPTPPPNLSGDDKKTADFINKYLDSKNSPAGGQHAGEYMVKYGKENHVDPLILLSIAGQETNFGKTGIGVNGMLGVGAYDNDPHNATRNPTFSGVENQIKRGAETFAKLRARAGLDENAPIAQQIAAVNRQGWATDTAWHNGVTNQYARIAQTAATENA